MARVIVAGGMTRDPVHGSWAKGDVAIEGPWITAVGDVDSEPDDVRIDASETLVLPGMVNAHTHAHNNLLKGTGDRRWLEAHINAMSTVQGWTPHDLYVSTLLGIVEMLRSGSTVANDMVRAHSEEHLAAVVQAYEDSGMRVVLAPAISDLPFLDAVPGLAKRLPADARPDGGGASTRASLDFAEAAIERWHGAADGRVHIAVGPVIPDVCSDRLLSGCARLAKDAGVRIHTHLLESKHQALNGVIRGGGRPWVTHLDELGFMDASSILAHSVWMTPEEVDIVAYRGATVVHNPASNLKMGSGIAPVREYRDCGVNVALGTDGAASGDALDMFGAMWLSALVSHVRTPDPDTWLSAPDVLDMATGDGARGLVVETGSLEVGRRADMVLVSLESLVLHPLNDPTTQLVFGYPGTDVRMTMVDGRIVMEDGVVAGVDHEALLVDVDAAARRLGCSAQLQGFSSLVERELAALQPGLASVPYPVDRFGAR